MSVDLLDFVTRCKRVAKQALGKYAGEPASGGFARWVHVTIHCLRIEEDYTYREVVNRIQYNTAVCDVLGIDPENVPEFTTIYRSFDRFVMGVWRALLRASAQELPRSGHAAIDSTFFERFHASRHYTTRADRAVETLKATALVDTAAQAVLDVQCTTNWRHDTVLGPQVVRRNADDLLSLSADKGFDAAAFRNELRESGLRKVWILTAPIGCMSGTRRFDVTEHLSEAELDTAINEAQKADEARLVRRLCFVKNLYAGDVLEEAARRVGVSQANSSRWAHAWNDAGIDGLRPSFGGGPPPKLSNEQFASLCEILEEGQPWTPRAIHALIEDRYGITYDPAHLSRKLRASGMHYAKPRPMDPRSPENADEILAERLGEALGEKETDEQEDEPVVLGFFR